MAQIKPFRIKLETAGNKLDIDFRAHEKDPENLVVVKATHPEAIDNLIMLTGVDPEVKQSFKGSHYFITELTKQGAAKLIAALVVGLATKEEAQKLYAETADDDDGEDDYDA